LKFSIAKKGVDLRRKDLALEPRLYRFTFGQAAIVVRIDSLAEPGDGSRRRAAGDLPL